MFAQKIGLAKLNDEPILVIRKCQDVPFVYTNTLLKVLCKRANKFNTMECPNQLISSRICVDTDICT